MQTWSRPKGAWPGEGQAAHGHWAPCLSHSGWLGVAIGCGSGQGAGRICPRHCTKGCTRSSRVTLVSGCLSFPIHHREKPTLHCGL